MQTKICDPIVTKRHLWYGTLAQLARTVQQAARTAGAHRALVKSKLPYHKCWLEHTAEKPFFEHLFSSQRASPGGGLRQWTLNKKTKVVMRQYCHPFSDVSGNTYLLFVKGNTG